MSASAYLGWFGRDVVIAFGSVLETVRLPSGDEIPALVEALRRTVPSGQRVRIGYQPIGLDVHPTSCPNGSRAALAATLAHEFPTIGSTTTCWAATPPRPANGTYASLLCIDGSDRLRRLQSALESNGVEIDGVWPITNLFDAVAAAKGADDDFVGILNAGSIVLVYACRGAGLCSVNALLADQAQNEISVVLRNAVGDPETSALGHVFVVDLAEVPLDLASTVVGDHAPEQIDPVEFLSALRTLRRGDTSDFLPRRRRPSFRRCCQLAALVFFAASLWNLASWHQAIQRVRGDASAQSDALAQLRLQLEHLRDNQRVVDLASRLRGELTPGSHASAGLLQYVIKHKPRELTLRSFRLEEDRFEITGVAHEGVGERRGPYFSFLDTLSDPAATWRVLPESRPAVLERAEFVITGVLK